jgi:hypothetical protein
MEDVEMIRMLLAMAAIAWLNAGAGYLYLTMVGN